MRRRRNPFSAKVTSWGQAEMAARDAMEEERPGWRERVIEIIGQVSDADLGGMLVDLTQNILNADHVKWAKRAGVRDKVSPVTASRRIDEWNVIGLSQRTVKAPSGWLAAVIIDTRIVIENDDLLQFMFKDATARVGAGSLLGAAYELVFDPADWLARQRKIPADQLRNEISSPRTRIGRQRIPVIKNPSFQPGDRVVVNWNGAMGVVVDGREYVEQVRADRGDAAAARAQRDVDRGDRLYIRSSGSVRGHVGFDPRGEHEVFAKGEIFFVSPSEASFVENPSDDTNPDRERAVEKYEEFNRYEPKKVGDFPGSFKIPARVHRVGDAKWVTYRSGKVDPASLRLPKKAVDYIHEHDAGVSLYVPTGELDTDVPSWLTDCHALVKLGTCLGYGFVHESGAESEGQARSPYPELYTTPDGHALVVVQDKQKILAMMWGGSLGVEGRGIVG